MFLQNKNRILKNAINHCNIRMLPQKLFYRALISESKQTNTIRGKNLQERSEIRNCLVR